MAKTDFKSVDEYLATLPQDVQAILGTVRQTIREAVPDAEEVISYQIPAFRYHGWLVYFSGYAKHFSLSCPPPFAMFEAFREQLAPYKQSKSAVQFPLDQPVPVDLIREMVTFQAADNVRREAEKPAKSRRT